MKMSIYSRFFFCLLTFSVYFRAFADFSTLDAILDRAKTLDDFLSNTELLDQYYNASKEYYSTGGKGIFSREMYDAVLEQLSYFKESIPGIKDRLWEKKDPETPIKIQTRSESSLENWEATRAEVISQLEKEVRNFVLGEGPDGIDRIIRQQLAYEDFRKKYRRPPTPVDPQKPSDQAFKGAITLKIIQYLKESFSNPPDPKADIKVLMNIRTPSFHFDGFPAKNKSIMGMIKNVTPNPNHFERKATQQEWSFRPILRAFHGAFRGIEPEECVGGKTRGELMLNRWALPVLRGNRLYYVERDGNFRGYIHEIPIQQEEQPQLTLASLDILAYDFPKTMHVVNRGSDFGESTTLFNAWYQEAYKHKPREWDGYAMSDGATVNNASGRDGIFSNPVFTLSKVIGPAQTFHAVDKEMEKTLYAGTMELSKRFGSHVSYDTGKGVYECSLEVAPYRNILIYQLADPRVLKSPNSDPNTIHAQHLRETQSSNPHARFGAYLHLLRKEKAESLPPLLVQMLRDPSEAIHLHAMNQIEVILARGNRKFGKELWLSLFKHPNPKVRSLMLNAVEHNPGILRELVELLQDPSPKTLELFNEVERVSTFPEAFRTRVAELKLDYAHAQKKQLGENSDRDHTEKSKSH